MGELVYFDGITRLNLAPQRVVEQVPDDLQGVVVMGYTAEGDYYFASSYAASTEVLWLAEALKKRLFDITEELGG